MIACASYAAVREWKDIDSFVLFCFLTAQFLLHFLPLLKTVNGSVLDMLMMVSRVCFFIALCFWSAIIVVCFQATYNGAKIRYPVQYSDGIGVVAVSSLWHMYTSRLLRKEYTESILKQLPV